MSALTVGRPSDSSLENLLLHHPQVVFSSSPSPAGTVLFEQDGRARRVAVGYPLAEVHGLVELADNNPMVCAASVSVPTPAETLALIALGPAFLARIVTEEPVLQTNSTVEDVPSEWKQVGWDGNIEFVHEERPMGTVLAAQAMCVIQSQDDWSSIDDLYDEAFGRSFYVKRDESSEWHADLVRDRPWAVFRLRLTADEPTALLTVQVMADTNGKCGASQLVHAMNVMAGFEECLGIPDRLTT